MKKNVCVATWFSSSNCGTCLQAKALYDAIGKKYNSKMLSYNRDYSIFNFHDLIMMKNKVVKKFKNKKNNDLDVNEDRKKRIDSFVNNSFDFVDIPVGKKRKTFVDDMHCFVVGSDQLWNPYWYDERYYLDFVKDNSKKKSYATSIGISSIPDNMKRKMKKRLKLFSDICVRENTAKNILEEMLDRDDIKVVSDPTFLLSCDDWRNIYDNNSKIDIKGKYMLCYFVGGIATHFDKISNFAKKNKLKIVVIPMNNKDYGYSDVEYAEAGPYEFLKLIDNAEYVCTDSFHALTISLSFNKCFSVFGRHKTTYGVSQSSRIEELLERYELNGAYNNLDKSFWKNIDYSKINKMMLNERERCLDTLYKMIEGNR